MIEDLLKTAASFIPYAIAFVIYLIKHERRLTRIETDVKWLIINNSEREKN